MATFTATSHLEPYDRLSPSLLRAEFKNKSVLITGGGTGIGASVARSFAEAGVAHVVLASRTEGALKSTAAQLTGEFPAVKFTYHIVDVTSKDSVQSLFDALKDLSLDVLINNAGMLPELQLLPDADLEGWWRGFEVNVLGTVIVTQAFLRHRAAVATKSDGPREPAAIITLNTFGAIGLRVPNFTSYAASKIAILRALELMRVEVPAETARFISVNPGAVKTALSIRTGFFEAGVPETHPRLPAEFIVWTASQEAAFLDGRFAWSSWDVDELLAKKEEILEKDLLITDIKGW